MNSLRERLLRHKRPSARSGEPSVGTPEEREPAHADSDGVSSKRADVEHEELESERAAAERRSVSSDDAVSGHEGVEGKRDKAMREGVGNGQAEAVREAESAETLAWRELGAELQPGEWGDFVMRRIRYGLDHEHGLHALGQLRERADRLQHLLAAGKRSGSRGKRGAQPTGQTNKPSNERPDDLAGDRMLPGGIVQGLEQPLSTAVERLLFIDTETTGLGQGAGNVPFMVGIGYMEADCFTVEQMLIRHPGEEASMLAYLQTKIAERPILISYNGKSFDWPIVRSRFILNRIPLPVEPEGHIDFLYPSRSLWKRTLPSVRLGQVETSRLGVFRSDDVPGSMAPVLYFQYLAERNPGVLSGVFRHNEWDVLTLAGLAIHLTRLLGDESDSTDVQAFGREEWFRYGLWLEKCGLPEAALITMKALASDLTVQGTDEGTERVELDACVLPLAQFFKKNGRYEEAVTLWNLYIRRKGRERTASLEPFIELSMYYEHKDKQLDLALQYAREAEDVLWRRDTLKRRSSNAARLRSAGEASDGTSREAADLTKRIERLKRKAANAAARAGKSCRNRREGVISKRRKKTGQLDLLSDFT